MSALRLTAATEPDESLTLDNAARERAYAALQNALSADFRSHVCTDYNDGDGCEVCWAVAADIVRAAEGLGLCPQCRGSGDVGGYGFSCCPDCGGNGLMPLAEAEDNQPT